jgi:hypothetical protein
VTFRGPWLPVVHASDLPTCHCCDDPWCPTHNQHYGDCPCLGPTEDGVVYRQRDGVLEGRRKARRVDRCKGTVVGKVPPTPTAKDGKRAC